MALSFMELVFVIGPLRVVIQTDEESAPWFLPQLIWSEGIQSISGKFKGITHAEQNKA